MVKGLAAGVPCRAALSVFPCYPAQMAYPETGKDPTPDLRSPVSRCEIRYGEEVRISGQSEVKLPNPAYHTYRRILTDGEVP
jgi:hypothetical protein